MKTAAPGRTILHFATHGFFQREGLKSLWQAELERAREHDDEPRGLGAMMADAGSPTVRPRARDPFAGQPPLEGEEPGLLAGLVLAGANLDPGESPDRDDGLLTATEVANMDLDGCRLAVLSACQSSLGTGNAGEGLHSMRRAFQEAGARSVIASLWKVDDEATQRLMKAFYEGLWKEGLGVSAALRRARLELLREDKDPYYWAAFTVSGDWR